MPSHSTPLRRTLWAVPRFAILLLLCLLPLAAKSKTPSYKVHKLSKHPKSFITSKPHWYSRNKPHTAKVQKLSCLCSTSFVCQTPGGGSYCQGENGKKEPR